MLLHLLYPSFCLNCVYFEPICQILLVEAQMINLTFLFFSHVSIQCKISSWPYEISQTQLLYEVTLIYISSIFIQIIAFCNIACAFSSCYSQVCCLVSKCLEICLLSFCYLCLVQLPCDKRTNTLCMISIIFK